MSSGSILFVVLIQMTIVLFIINVHAPLATLNTQLLVSLVIPVNFLHSLFL